MLSLNHPGADGGLIFPFFPPSNPIKPYGTLKRDQDYRFYSPLTRQTHIVDEI